LAKRFYEPSRRRFKQKAILVGLRLPQSTPWQVDDSIAELEALATTAGAEVLARLVQARERIDPATYIGSGKVDELFNLATEEKANLVIFDDDLTPAQVRNLESKLKVPVIDRSGLILDIFALRARTKEAKTQVSLAQMKYLLPRLAGRWTHLERQEGAIGTRGPGETQLETDRRQVQKRISDLERNLERIDREREVQRKRRRETFTAALIGYTNAGKSTLLNLLSRSRVLAEDRLFATLDATTRRVTLGEKSEVLLTDTVGFIKKLPVHLVASFRSTLREILEADLLLHLVDASHREVENHLRVAEEILRSLRADGKPQLLVFNKIDLLPEVSDIARLRNRHPGSVFISCTEEIGTSHLLQSLREIVQNREQETSIFLGREQERLYSLINRHTKILETVPNDGGILLRVRGRREWIDRLRRMAGS
jgi:GTP-binding protein HflX